MCVSKPFIIPRRTGLSILSGAVGWKPRRVDINANTKVSSWAAEGPCFRVYPRRGSESRRLDGGNNQRPAISGKGSALSDPKVWFTAQPKRSEKYQYGYKTHKSFRLIGKLG